MVTISDKVAIDIAKDLKSSKLVNVTDLQKAISVLESSALPTTRDEAWKYTRVSKIGKTEFHNSKSNIENAEDLLIDPEAISIIFVNGYYYNTINETNESVAITILNNSNIAPPTRSKLDGEVFHALNTAYLNGGVIIDIPSKTQLSKPIQLIHLIDGDQVISNFRTVINIGESSSASVIQGFHSSGAKSFCNALTEVHVNRNASLHLDKIQNENEQSFHIATEQVIQEPDSTFSINTFTLNGGLVRNNLNIDVNGHNCVSYLNGAYVLNNKQHVDNHTTVDHKVAHCESHELYKGVIDDSATAVFNGKVYVRKDAQKINAFQSNGNVLLSDNGTVNSSS